jgi:GTP cyclohydrolase I
MQGESATPQQKGGNVTMSILERLQEQKKTKKEISTQKGEEMLEELNYLLDRDEKKETPDRFLRKLPVLQKDDIGKRKMSVS